MRTATGLLSVLGAGALVAGWWGALAAAAALVALLAHRAVWDAVDRHRQVAELDRMVASRLGETTRRWPRDVAVSLFAGWHGLDPGEVERVAAAREREREGPQPGCGVAADAGALEA